MTLNRLVDIVYFSIKDRKGHGLRINETASHYIVLFTGLGLIIGIALLGWRLVEYSQWFAEIWASEFNRWLIIFGSLFALLWLFISTYSYFWGRKKLIRTFKKVDFSRIEDCKDGDVVRIQGHLKLLSPSQIAPLSERKCTAYTIRVSEMVDRVTVRGTGSNVGSDSAWETIKFVEVANDFLIQCGSHYAVVRASGAKVFIHADTSHDETTYEKDRGGFLTQSENEKRERVLENVGISPKFYIGIYGADVKFEEGVLEPDEQVAVLGLG